jgi:hypothetical protein
MVCWPNPFNRHDGCGGVEKEQVDVKGDSWEVESRTHGTKSRWELDAFLSAESRGAFMSSGNRNSLVPHFAKRETQPNLYHLLLE